MEFGEKCKDCTFVNNLSDILNYSRDVLYKFNLKTNSYEFVSSAIKDIAGLTPEQVIDKGVECLTQSIHPDDLQQFNLIYQKLLNNEITEDSLTLEYRTKNHNNGKYLWRSDHINIIRDENGDIEYIVGNCRDITKSKQIEKNLTQLLENYKRLYDSAEVALFRSSLEDGRMLDCNDKLVEILRYDSKEDCMKNFVASEKYVDPNFREKMKKLLVENGYFNDMVAEVYRKDGTVCCFSYSARLYPQKGYLEGSAHEITDIRNLTSTEKEVLKNIVSGFSNREIAEKMERSVRTIEDHRSHIMEKMGTKNLVHLTKRAIDAGIA